MDIQTQNDEFASKNSLQGTGKGELAIMGQDGDTKIVWSVDQTAEVNNARETFQRLRKDGYLIYRVVGDKGDKGEQMTEFDPNAGRMIAAPAMRGG